MSLRQGVGVWHVLPNGIMQAIRLPVVIKGFVMRLLAGATEAETLAVSPQLQLGCTGGPAHSAQALICHRNLVVDPPGEGPHGGPAPVPAALMPALALVPCTALTPVRCA